MCEWGTYAEVDNQLPFGGQMHRRTWKIDECIAPIVKALNDAGIDTVASCCGHGKGDGRIDLLDGRVLLVIGEKHGQA